MGCAQCSADEKRVKTSWVLGTTHEPLDLITMRRHPLNSRRKVENKNSQKLQILIPES